MKQLRPVIWSKGVLLTPQHLQVQDRFIESLLSFHLNSLSFQPWGFSELQINREGLSKKMFSLSRATGILPDGLLFSIPDSDSAPDSRRIELDKYQNSADIYLAIPNYLERGTNVGIDSQTPAGKVSSQGSARYRAEDQLVRDENSGGSERPVKLGRKNFRLLTSEDSREGCVTMRIARVVKGPAVNSLELDEQFVPPLLNIGSSPYLETIIKRLLEIMSSKSADLGGMRRHKNQSLAEFSTADIPNFWLLYTVNTYLPELRHIIETRKGHPAPLFDTLLSMAGALTTFSATIKPRDFPLYDHDDLGSCFRSLDETLRTLLDTVVPVNFASLPMKLIQPCIYATALSDDKYFAGAQIYLAVAAEMPEAELIQQVPRLLKVSSGDRVPQLMSHSSEGVTLSFPPTPPSTIPIKTRYQYFVVNQAGKEWDAVRRARNLAAYVPDIFIDPRIEIWIVLPQNS